MSVHLCFGIKTSTQIIMLPLLLPLSLLLLLLLLLPLQCPCNDPEAMRKKVCEKDKFQTSSGDRKLLTGTSGKHKHASIAQTC